MAAITKILFRRGLDAQRKTVIFNLGEPAFSVDTKRLFIGDGNTAGGVPVSIVNYGIVNSLSGSYVYSSTQTNLASSAAILLSAANIGDFVYDQATTSLYSLTSTSVLPALSNFAHLYNASNVNSSQLYYNGSQLNILNAAGGGYGVGINEINSSITAGSNALSGGSGNPLNIASGRIANNLITPGVVNSVKVTDNTGTIVDISINQNQLLGRTNSAGTGIGPVTLSATGNLSLSSNSNTILFSMPFCLPLSGGSLTGGVSALSASGGRFVTDVVPVNPTDVVNLNYINGFSCTQPSYLFSHFLNLTGGYLTGPGTLTIDGVTIINNNTGITGALSAGSLTITGSISALQGLSATGIQSYAAPVVGFDVTNKSYTDSKFIPLSGGTFTGRTYNANAPVVASELTNKAYVDSLQSYVGGNFLALSGGTVTGAISSTDRIYVTNTPVVSAELANKNYVDTQVVNATPIGCIAHFATSTPPAGWLKVNGAVLPIANYQNLFNSLPKSGGNTIWWRAGDGPTNFRLPDLRGQFIRGWADPDTTGNGNGAIVGAAGAPAYDAGRAFGLSQTDQLQGHIHGTGAPTPSLGTASGSNQNGAWSTVTYYSGDPLNDGTNGDPRYGNETRPTNIALLACIKY